MFALPWHAGDTPEQRRWLIDHQGGIVGELRRRGRVSHATVVRDEENTEHYAVRIAPHDGEDDMAG